MSTRVFVALLLVSSGDDDSLQAAPDQQDEITRSGQRGSWRSSCPAASLCLQRGGNATEQLARRERLREEINVIVKPPLMNDRIDRVARGEQNPKVRARKPGAPDEVAAVNPAGEHHVGEEEGNLRMLP
jgi:hypothetical protein